MPLKRRAVQKIRNFSVPVSYRINETGDYFRDCSNVVSNQGRLETRYGYSRYNAVALAGKPLSLSYFKRASGSRYILAKIGTEIYSVSSTNAHTLLKSGLSATTKHRAITLNDRHIITCESDGMFSFDGTTFTQLGQVAPTPAPNCTNAGGGSLAAGAYKIAYTYYSTSTGFETNIGTPTSLTLAANDKITFGGAAPGAGANATINKINVYMKALTGPYLFIEEIALGATPSTISDLGTSTQIPPTKNAAPPAGGAKYIATINKKVVIAGNSNYPNDIFFSEPDIPDAWDDGETQTVLNAEGDGEVRGIGVGLYDTHDPYPFLLVFKSRLTKLWADVFGSEEYITVDDRVGCVCHDTITTRNGNVLFLSEMGWREVKNGRILRDKQGKTATMGMGAVDDVFRTPGFIYEINKSNFANFHSVYSSSLNLYMTFISEGVATDLNKAYAYEWETQGFKPFLFPVNINCSASAEDTNSNEIVLFGTDNEYLLKHSRLEDRTDIDLDNNQVTINATSQIVWSDGDDYDASFNFRELLVRGLQSGNDVLVKAWVNYSFDNTSTYSYAFSDGTGFRLDLSVLDQDVLGDDRAPQTKRADINRVGENICIGFYQSVLNGNISLMSAQLNFSKNGNRNA